MSGHILPFTVESNNNFFMNFLTEFKWFCKCCIIIRIAAFVNVVPLSDINNYESPNLMYTARKHVGYDLGLVPSSAKGETTRTLLGASERVEQRSSDRD